jgi:hypothetical protein
MHAPIKPVTPKAPDPVVETKQTVDVDHTLLQDCPVQDKLDVRQYSKQDALKAIKVLIDKYSTCWHTQHELSDVAKKAFNIKDVPATPAVPASAASSVSIS